MTSAEKLYQVHNLIPPKTRSEIPVYPQIITWAGTAAGVSQAEMIRDSDIWIEALAKTYDIIGNPDVSSGNVLDDNIFVMGLPAKRPGQELGDNELYQFIESPFFDDPGEYKKILQMGWTAWYGKYMVQIQNMKSFDELGARFALLGQNCGKVAAMVGRRGIELNSHAGGAPIYDKLSLIRSMQEFILDIYSDPGPIMDVVRKFQPEEDQKNVEMLKKTGGTRICLYSMRSCAPFVSPSMFEEYIWPTLKQTIETFHAAGITVILHADANWLPMLHYYTQLPKGSVQFEFDGVTDMFKAYDIVGGWQSMRGDVPATMLAFGTPDEVSQYCEKLINGIGMKGGFMLGSGCEVPLNAKVECVKAMMDSVK